MKSPTVIPWIPPQQHVYFYDTCTKYNSYRKCHVTSKKSFLRQLSEIGQQTNKRKGFGQQGTLQFIRENTSDRF